jgi:hypothetical protein
MPAKRTPADGPAASQPTEPEAAVSAEPEGAAETDGAEESAPLNRAERRAKGKQRGGAQPTYRGKAVGGKGPAGSQRMWANRRSG